MAIDEKKLIEAMFDRYNTFYNNANFFDEYQTDVARRVLSDMCTEIEKLSLENKTSDWIPVTERLPKQNERIFATFKSEKGNLIVSEVKFYYELVHDPLPMIAWMPLPEPYKGGE